jgi:aspartate aminotransferase
MKADADRQPAVSRWLRQQLEAGGWVRRMFAEGQRLRAQYGQDAVSDLALGQPLGDPSPEVRNAIHAAAEEGFAGRFGYMPNLGYPEVRRRAAADVDGAVLDESCIAMTGGAAAAMCLALRVFVDAGDEVIGAVPYFGEYPAYCAAVGATWVPVPTSEDFAIDADAVAAALSERTAAVIVNSPCNPSGHVATEVELESLAAVMLDHHKRSGRRVLLIVDEVYRQLVFPPATRVEPFSVYPFTALARSFSKDLGLAGERIGYLALHPEIASATAVRGLETAQRALGFVNAPATMQRMLLHLASWAVDIAPYRERRDRALDLARSAGLDAVETQGGLYVWARSPWRDGLAFVTALAERRVLVAPGIAFGMPEWLRICFTTAPSVLEHAMDVVADLSAVEVKA